MNYPQKFCLPGICLRYKRNGRGRRGQILSRNSFSNYLLATAYSNDVSVRPLAIIRTTPPNRNPAGSQKKICKTIRFSRSTLHGISRFFGQFGLLRCRFGATADLFFEHIQFLAGFVGLLEIQQ